jgi:hypothetical protein
MRLRRRLVATVLVIVAAASIGESPPGVANAAGCPSTPLTVGELRSLWDGEYAGFAGMTNPRGRACYGGADVRVIGFVDVPDGLGGTSASGIKPGWLTEWGLWIYGTSNAIATDHANDSYTIATAPKLGDLNERYARRWVVVTAHFDDPRARTCRGWGVEPPTKKEAVRVCRSIMVLSSISTTSAPDTATTSGRGDAPGEVAPWLLAVAGLLGSVAWVGRPRRRSAP